MFDRQGTANGLIGHGKHVPKHVVLGGRLVLGQNLKLHKMEARVVRDRVVPQYVATLITAQARFRKYVEP